MSQSAISREVEIPAGNALLAGHLEQPSSCGGLVIFAHGSGSSRFSPRNQQVARTLNQGGIGTLLFDLLTEEEERADRYSRAYRFDIDLLGERLVYAIDWLSRQDSSASLRFGIFGASTGAAAALIAAARRPEQVAAVVSRGGRPDLALEALSQVSSPTLFIVGELDREVILLSQRAQSALGDNCQLEIIPGASHLFEEANTLDRAAQVALNWFRNYLDQR